jgi:hypothetical protein
MQEIFSVLLDSPCKAVFICKDVVGVIPYADDDALFSIRAFNYNTKISINISLELGYPIVSLVIPYGSSSTEFACVGRSIIRPISSAPSLKIHPLSSQQRRRSSISTDAPGRYYHMVPTVNLKTTHR